VGRRLVQSWRWAIETGSENGDRRRVGETWSTPRALEHWLIDALIAIRSLRKRWRYPANTGSVRRSTPGRRSARAPLLSGSDER
jgi:hypothetical protein